MLNRCTFIGNLGRDAELRYTQGGDPVATLNLAVNEKWKNQAGQLQERTEWVRVVLWGKTAESLSQYLLKGKQIYVEGKMQTRKWTDKDGTERYSTEIRSDRIQLLGGGGNGNNQSSGGRYAKGNQNQQQAQPHNPEPDDPLPGDGLPDEDDIPF